MVPEDFEASHGMTGGNWHHGELSIDQALMMRPFPGRLSTPVVLKGFISVVRDRIREEASWVLRGKTPRKKYSSRGSYHGAAERKTMLLTTPFHSRVEQYCELNDWGAWQATLRRIPTSMWSSSTSRFAARGRPRSLPMNKYRISGPDAEAFLNRLVTRDVSKIGVIGSDTRSGVMMPAS